ncbi:Oidioi.mRNA.OKI2018_I69.chr2.g6125.t1.cds [Oikopleura dioica]|uniref:Oidioi.mRNA.OKI2018_I69.chr2.g6125.t1.cds n=1 Tax=Oikopleura dioica TaxID=34765 RepID=A0ABN7T5N4_OIKDI|nr:Oidioi.mRNA.OKI2018_I69.chr2.g6125.t1.cds [Oikopleura dioica]
MSIEDPYFVVRDDVAKAVDSCEKRVVEWRRIMEGTSTSVKARNITSELRSAVRSAEWDLEDLEESVKVVENNPSRFGIADDELRERKSFIVRIRNSLADMKSELEAPDVNERLLAMDSSPHVTINVNNSRYGNSNPAFRDNNGGYSQQSQLLQEQDGQLELVSNNVRVLNQISRAIGDELDDQGQLLDNLGNEIDSAQSRMNATLSKIQRVTRLSTDRRQWAAIAGLAFLIVILFIMLFS